MSASRILVVEDTELLRRMYRDRLVADGFDVLTAGDGQEALATLRTGRMDLMLLDLIMPRMGGLEVLEVMRHDPVLSRIPVVVLTNLDEGDAAERALALGAREYLIKNETRPADISARVATVLSEIAAYSAAGDSAEPLVFDVYLRPDEGDVDRLVSDACLQRRLWCPTCESALVLTLVAKPDSGGWYDAHFVCRSCGRDFRGHLT